MPVARLLDELDSYEMSEWLVFFRLRHARREREAKGLPPPETRESLRERFASRIIKVESPP